MNKSKTYKELKQIQQDVCELEQMFSKCLCEDKFCFLEALNEALVSVGGANQKINKLAKAEMYHILNACYNNGLLLKVEYARESE